MEQRLHHLSQGFVPDGVEAKSRHDPASRTDKKRKMDACGRMMSPHAEHPEVSCTYWYHPVIYYQPQLETKWLRKMWKIAKNLP